MVLFAFQTDIGRVREKNEDAFGSFGEELFLVADGLGGLPAGEVAAQLAVKTAIRAYQETGDLQRAFEVANREIYRQSRANPAYFGMATTLVGVVIKGKQANLANVGDSRAYLVETDQITQITIDHSLGWEIITRALGIKPEVKVDLFSQKLKSGSLLLLCSDGLTNMLTDEQLLMILKQTGEDQAALAEKAAVLVKAAKEAGGIDNITVGLIKVIEKTS